MKGCNDIFRLISVFEGHIKQIPAIDYEEKVISDSHLVCVWDSLAINGAHDSNQDVQETNQHDDDRDVENKDEV
jgi:hypothetical protein